MEPQLALEGFEAREEQRESLFFALFPDAATAAELTGFGRRLQAQHGLRGNLLATEQLHLTLHYLGDYSGIPASVLQMARRAAAAVAMPPFECVFEQALSFPAPRSSKPFVLRAGAANAELLALHHALGQALAFAGLGRWVKAAWTPHVTLLYASKVVVEQPVAPIRWTAREFVLVRSLIGKNHYVREAAWPLQGLPQELR